MEGIRIEYLTSRSPRVTAVQHLLLEHSRTLGFFPQGALRDYVERGQVLVALDRGECVGFLTFRPRQETIRIVHLCVAETHRGMGVARRLVDCLSKEKSHFHGIGLTCRADYGLDDFWRKLGFVPRQEGPGRGRDRATLVFYWLDHRHPGLFDALPSPRIRAALDANVVLDLLDSRNEEAQALKADWLDDEAEYLYTPHLFQDLAGRHSPSELADQLHRLDWLRPLELDVTHLEETVLSLSSLLGPRNQPSWTLDLKQIASAIIGDCPFFVTRDRELLEGAAAVRDRYGLSIVRPAKFITHIDELKDRAKYQAGRLSGTILVCRKVDADHIDRLAPFIVHGPETRSSFERRLGAHVASPRDNEVLVISAPGEEACGLVVYALKQAGRLEVPLVRTTRPGHPYLVASHLLTRALQRASDEERFLITVTDPHLQPETLQALTDLGFSFRNPAWFRYALARVATSLEVRDVLLAKARQFPDHRDSCEELADRAQLLRGTERPHVPLSVEKTLWPLKLTDAPIPSFIVPIKPRWATHLFDPGLATQTLFGGDQELMLRPQNVYYRRSRPGVIAGPGRVLWYVTKDPRYTGTMSLRACSYIDNVELGDADACYDKYRHLGVFSRHDVREVAGGAPVMAFTFSHTELFPHPVPFATVRATLRAETGAAPTFQSPLSVSPACFARLYWLGKRGSLEGFQVEEGPRPSHSVQVH